MSVLPLVPLSSPDPRSASASAPRQITVSVPHLLLRAYAHDPLAIGCYVAIARCAFAARGPVTLSAGDLATWSGAHDGTTRTQIWRRMHTLIDDGWLTTTAANGCKLTLTPCWGRDLAGIQRRWRWDRPLLGRPTRLTTIPVPCDLLDATIGRIVPQPTRPAVIERYITAPALTLADIGIYALLCAGIVYKPSSALSRLHISAEWQAVSLRTILMTIAATSNSPLPDQQCRVALNARGRALLGLAVQPDAQTMAPPRSETMAPSRSETMAPPRSETMAPPRSETMAPPRSETMAPPRSETMAPPRSETIAPPRSETIAPTRSHDSALYSDKAPFEAPRPDSNTASQAATQEAIFSPRHDHMESMDLKGKNQIPPHPPQATQASQLVAAVEDFFLTDRTTEQPEPRGDLDTTGQDELMRSFASMMPLDIDLLIASDHVRMSHQALNRNRQVPPGEWFELAALERRVGTSNLLLWQSRAIQAGVHKRPGGVYLAYYEACYAQEHAAAQQAAQPVQEPPTPEPAREREATPPAAQVPTISDEPVPTLDPTLGQRLIGLGIRSSSVRRRLAGIDNELLTRWEKACQHPGMAKLARDVGAFVAAALSEGQEPPSEETLSRYLPPSRHVRYASDNVPEIAPDAAPLTPERVQAAIIKAGLHKILPAWRHLATDLEPTAESPGSDVSASAKGEAE